MGRRIRGCVLGLALFGTALFLLGDATTSALMPATGERIRGCYTAVELLVGVSEPSPIRPVELVLGFALLIWATGKVLRGAWRVLRHGSTTSLQGAD